MGEQTRTLRNGLAVTALLAPLAAFGILRAFPRLDPMIMASTFHFYVVGFTALAAALACAVVMASARTLQNSRLIFLGLAFFSIAGIFAVHGLNTPGFLADEYYSSLGVSAWLSAFAGSVFVALSVVGLPHRIDHMIERNGKAIFVCAVLAVFGYVALSLREPTAHWLDWVPVTDRNAQFGVGLAALALIGFAVWRYYQAYLFARLPSQLAMIATLVILLEVQVIILWGQVWHLSWWFYHGLYGVAFLVLFTGWAIEVRRAGTLRAIADALSMRDALAQLNRGLEQPILDLVDAVEAKDRETFGHVRRVSGYALAVGRRLGLSPQKLRSLALAAEMHDVGKISVPSSILAKPGPLTDEEFGVIKLHTIRGYEIAEQVKALRDLAEVIRHHHERYDGAGYPDGLAGDEIPLLSRVITVADAYDAITSQRPYRDSRSHEQAIAEIVRLKGVQFDPACVDVFVTIFSEPGTRQESEQAAA
jgi:HD-GYP domain-containing protein (c-di-GMP phosphodiesterase class II)